jgi:micrococcal nuclease
MKRILLVLLIIFIFLLTYVLLNNPSQSRKPTEITREATSSGKKIEAPREEANVLRVIDGDTIELTDKRRVRYIGMDTPEIVDPGKPVECYGKEAADENRRLVEGKTVYLEKDISETDSYGRLLRYVFIGDVFVNQYLVQNGFARIETVQPDTKNKTLFMQSEHQAKIDNIGLWATCGSSPSR